MESVNDIIAELRSVAFSMKAHDAMMPEVYDILCGVASRLESAWKRERAEPMRNCDCYKDADSAYIAFCGYDFAAKDISDSAFIDWLFAPAKEEGANDER